MTRYAIRGTAGDSCQKQQGGPRRNAALMAEAGVKAGERRRRRDGRALTVLGPSEHALGEGAVNVVYESGEEAVLYPATVAGMALEEG